MIGTVAVVVSTFLLHGYNAYSKEFEVTQIKLHSVSDVALRARDDAFKTINELSRRAYSRFEGLDIKTPVQMQNSIDASVANIRASADLLRPRFPESSKAIDQIIRVIQNQIAGKVGDKGFAPTGDEISQTNKKIVEFELIFLQAFDRELKGVLSAEFQASYAAFFSGLDNPVLWAAALILCAGIVLIIIVRSEGGVAKKGADAGDVAGNI